MNGENRVLRAAGFIMAAMFISRILGYLRDVVIYAWFGQNRLTDAYNAAFSIPDFLYMLLVGGALSSALIPVFSSYVATNKEDEGWEVLSTVFNLVMVLMLVGIGLGVVFTPQLVEKVLVPGFDDETTALTVRLTRIMFAQAFFMALSGISMGVLNSYKHFTSPAIGSVLYNLAIIGVGVLLADRFGVAGFSIGVVIGAMANFGVQLPALLRVGLRYRPAFHFRHPGVVKIASLMVPVLLGLSVTQLNLFVNQNLASTLSPGAVAALRTGQRLMMLPVGIFALAVSVAAFPTLTGQVARKEMDEFRRTMSLGLRSIVFLNLPAAAALIALREPVVRFLFQQGKFTADATQATGIALLYYAIGLVAYAAIHMLNRVFYAMHDTRTPVGVGVATIAVNIALNFALIRPMGHGGLALAYSVAGLFNMFVLMYLLRPRLGHLGGGELAVSFGKILLASVMMGFFMFGVADVLGGFLNLEWKVHQAVHVLVPLSIGALVYGGMALAFRMEEGKLAWGMLRRRLGRRGNK